MLFQLFFITELECPVKVCKQVPYFTSQIRIDLSELPETMLSPSGEKATLLTYIYYLELRKFIKIK
jgi:hypothetical protein